MQIPNDWSPRPYQIPLLKYLEGGGRRAAAVWHRRAGKDSVALNWTATQAIEVPGLYWHMLPTQKQGRKVVWDGLDKNGRRFIDQAFPKSIRAGDANETEMKIRLASERGESIWQVVGSDNYDSLVGGNPRGVVFSEWSLTDPRAWEFIRPVLAENGGWALFIYTPRGHNHGLSLYEAALKAPGWFAQVLTVSDTGFPLDAVQAERASGMPEDMIQQEFFCSFEASLVGSYFGEQMAAALREKRIGNVAHDPSALVDTWWDLGIADAMAIWFTQRVGQEIHLIAYEEHTGKGLDWYVNMLQRLGVERGYNYQCHVFPHDVNARELGSGMSRADLLRKLGVEPTVAPNLPVGHGIDAARLLMARCWWDAEKCERGIQALRSYRKEEDEDRSDGRPGTFFKPHPLHDWASHGADAFRMGAVTELPRTGRGKRQKIEYPSGPKRSPWV